MHWPVAFQYQGKDVKQPKTADGKVAIDETLTRDQSSTWREMERLVEAGLVRNIGVSNFCEARLTKLLGTCTLVPAVNQVELHPYNAQTKLVEFCHAKGVHVTAYSPLGSQDSGMLDDEVLKDIATAHDVDVGRVVIAWALQRGTSTIPKSVTPSRVVSNFGAKDVVLTGEQVARIDALDKGKRFVDPSQPWGVDIYCAEEGTASKL